MDMVTGYFTTENNIVGKTTWEIERVLGLLPRWLASGAEILVLERVPSPHEFEARGSTISPGADDLNAEALERTKCLPGAWVNRRLVRVEPIIRRVVPENSKWPRSLGIAAEQWYLTKDVPARVRCVLQPGQVYHGVSSWNVA